MLPLDSQRKFCPPTGYDFRKCSRRKESERDLEEVTSGGALNHEGGELPKHGLKVRASAATLIHHKRNEALRSRKLDRVHAPQILGKLNVFRFP